MPGEVEALLTANSLIRYDERRTDGVVHQSELDGMHLSIVAWYTFIEVRLLRGRSKKYPYLKIRHNLVSLAWLPRPGSRPLNTRLIFVAEDVPAFTGMEHLVNTVLAACPRPESSTTVLDYLKAAAIYDTTALWLLNAAYDVPVCVPTKAR